MRTSKSPKEVARVAYASARSVLPLYSHPSSPQKYTLAQLVSCLVLKEFFTTDYRGIERILQEFEELREILELKQVPHYTTLQKSAQRLLNQRRIRGLMQSILKQAGAKKLIGSVIAMAAMDGTGLESHHVSRYFTERRREQAAYYRRGFPKVGIVCDTSNHLVIAGIPERGPQFDRTHFKKALREATGQKEIDLLLTDAGYDAEANHQQAREVYGIKMITPATHAQRSDRLPRKGFYRCLMRTSFPKELYGQRWQIETVMSMLKRNLGTCTRARHYWSQCREILLRLFTHNVMIVPSTT